MEIQPIQGLDHAVSGQDHGTGPGNRAINKDLGSGEMIVVPRSEYQRLQDEVSALRSELHQRNARAQRFRKAIVGGAMFVGSWVVAPGVITAGALTAEVNLIQGHIAEATEKYPEFDYVTRYNNPDHRKHFDNLYGSKILFHAPLNLTVFGGMVIAGAGTIAIPFMGIARLMDRKTKKQS